MRQRLDSAALSPHLARWSRAIRHARGERCGRARDAGAARAFAAQAMMAQPGAPAVATRQRGALEMRRDRATARQGESASLAFPALHFDAREMHVKRDREPLRSLKNWRIEMLGAFSDEARQVWSINSRLRKREVSAEEAEAELKREGYAFGQLSDPNFDPTSRSEWTPLQAIAWIATRDDNRVRDVSFEARKRTVDWSWSDAKPELWDIGTNNLSRPAGYFIRLLSKPSMEQLVDAAPIAEEARMELWTRLRAGEIQASGLSTPNAPRVEVGALEWIDLRLFRDDVVFQGDQFLLSSHAFFKVLVDRSAIVSIWKDGRHSSGVLAGSTPAATLENASDQRPTRATKRAKLVEWLQEKFEERPPATVDELMKMVSQEEPNLGQFSRRTLETALSIAFRKE